MRPAPDLLERLADARGHRWRARSSSGWHGHGVGIGRRLRHARLRARVEGSWRHRRRIAVSTCWRLLLLLLLLPLKLRHHHWLLLLLLLLSGVGVLHHRLAQCRRRHHAGLVAHRRVATCLLSSHLGVVLALTCLLGSCHDEGSFVVLRPAVGNGIAAGDEVRAQKQAAGDEAEGCSRGKDVNAGLKSEAA